MHYNILTNAPKFRCSTLETYDFLRVIVLHICLLLLAISAKRNRDFFFMDCFRDIFFKEIPSD